MTGIMIVGIAWAALMMVTGAVLVAFANRARPWAYLAVAPHVPALRRRDVPG